MTVRNTIPNTKEFDVDVDGKCFLERRTLSPSEFVFARVHFVCEWNLLMIALREKANLMYPKGLLDGRVKHESIMCSHSPHCARSI